MCDYSIINAKTRPAVIGDKLETYQFGVTTGFTDYSPDEIGKVAVCLRPGTELAFDEPVAINGHYGNGYDCTSHVPFKQTEYRTAIFRQVDVDNPNKHHDCLEFPSGTTVFLYQLAQRQKATVLQLPAAPKNEAEAKEQARAEYVG